MILFKINAAPELISPVEDHLGVHQSPKISTRTLLCNLERKAVGPLDCSSNRSIKCIIDLGPKSFVAELRLHPLLDLILYLAPKLQLLFKAKNHRPKDDLDAATVIPELSPNGRSWLASHLPKLRCLQTRRQRLEPHSGVGPVSATS